MAVNNAGYASTLIGIINSTAPDSHVRLAMIMGSGLESTWSPATGDHGTSFGPFQIHLPAHPGVSANEAKDPTFAVRYMLPSYEAGAAKVSNALWQSDPKSAAALAAFYAERPAQMYASTRVASVWAKMQANSYGSGVPTAGSANAGGTDPGTDPTGGTGTGTDTSGFLGIPSASDIGDKVYAITMTAVFVLGGVGLVGLGLYRAVQPVMGNR